MREALAPLCVVPDMYDRHWTAGQSFTTKLFVLNDQFARPEPSLQVEAVLADSSGKELSRTALSFEGVPEQGRAEKPLSLKIPSELKDGDYVLKLRLLRKGRLAFESSNPLMVAAAKGLASRRIESSLRVACFDPKGEGAKVLKRCGLDFTPINSFEALDKFDLLVFAPDSLGPQCMGAGALIRSWLEKGGRLLCLEQSCAGPLPFAPELSLQSSGAMLFADSIATGHPLLQGLKPWYFELWNGTRRKVEGWWDASPKAVYSSFVVPMQEGVVLSGASRGAAWQKNPRFGMVAGEVRIGKGLLFLSQALASKRIDSDPVAAIYILNLLDYVAGASWDGSRASALGGAKAFVADPEKCFYVDLSKKANRPFTDEKDGDKAGGWTDQGRNDMSAIPKGRQNFGGAPFEIIDDKGGATPSCLVLFGKSRAYFPKEIAGIAVGRKATRLFFLHCSAWSVDGERAAHYLIRYAGGRTAKVDLVVGRNIGDWWSPKDLPEAPVACNLNPAGGNTIGLYCFAWKNPTPELAIESIDFVSAQGGSVPVCAAISGEAP